MNEETSMRGLFINGINEIGIRELPVPRPGRFEALVRMRACGICNSTDWKLIHGEFCPGSYPALLGHESIGEVVEIGAGVTSFSVGDLVLRPGVPDSAIPFEGGRSLWGGFAEYGLVRDAWAEQGVPYNAFPHPQQVVPADLVPELAIALITLKETMSCLRSTDVRAGMSLGIVGSGPVAEALAACASMAGVDRIVVFGRRPELAERFLAAGATAYLVDDHDLHAVGGPLDRVVEAVGSREALRRALVACSSEGRVNVYGVAPGSDPFAPSDMSDPRTFVGKVAEAEEHDLALALVASGRLRLPDWVDCVLPFEQYAQGFAAVAERRARKVAIRFD